MVISGCNHTHVPGAGTIRVRRNPPAPEARVAVVHPPDEHLVTLLRILRGSGYRSDWATDCADAQAMLAGADIPVVICESELPDGGWLDVMTQADTLPGRPLVIVTSVFADERLWAEVLNVGGYDVLQKPFQAEEVARVVRQALGHWPRTRGAGGVLDWPRSA